MNTTHILLIENSASIKALLEESLRSIKTESFRIEGCRTKDAEEIYRNSKKSIELVLFGEKIAASQILRLTQFFRRQNHHLHVIMLTRQSEAVVSSRLKNAGVDDMLNVLEISTPVFGWTFLSLLQHTGMKKKAAEYETIQARLRHVNEALEEITKKMNAPIGVIRSAVKTLNGHQKHVTTLLNENVTLMEQQLHELLEIRQKLGKETKVINKYLAVKSRS